MTEAAQDIRFVLLGHPADYDHFVELAQHSAKSAKPERFERHRATFRKFMEWMPSYVTTHRPAVATRAGIVTGRLVVCPFFPDEIKSPQQMKRAYDKVVAGCKLAKELGAHVVGLGGFTSILEGANGNVLAARLGLTITSGNALTAALAIEQVRAVLVQAKRPLERETVAVIGATGDIGRVCTLELAKSAKRLVLIARNRDRLEALRAEIGKDTGIEVASDPLAARRASVIVAAASASTPIITKAQLAPGTIACDVGYPKNLSEAPAARDDVLIFSGGLAKLPGPIDLKSYTRLPAPDLLHGCFSEAIVLAAKPEYLGLSTDQGGANIDRVKAIFKAASELGFEPAPPYRGDRRIAVESIERFGRGFVVAA